MSKILEFRWTVSKARDTYGYNICSLYVDGTKVASCNGGGYDMEGTSLGNWVEKAFKDKLMKLKEEFDGLTFHDPNYDPGKAVVEGQTIEEREKEGKSLGLERYQEFYSASSKVPTEKHTVPSIDGAYGFRAVERILEAIGYKLRYIPTRKRDDKLYELVEIPEGAPDV